MTTKLHSAAEAFEPQPPIEYLVDGLIVKPSLNVVYGPGEALKTYALLDLAIAVAKGDEWLDRKTQQNTVLIIDEENGSRRLNRWIHNIMMTRKAPKDLPLFYSSMIEGDKLNQIEGFIRETGAGLVILDALCDFMLGQDENAVKDVQTMLRALTGMVNQNQCVVIVIHHANKLGDFRGSTAIQAGVDLMLGMKKTQELVEFKCIKGRDGEIKPFSANVYFGDNYFELILKDSDTVERDVLELFEVYTKVSRQQLLTKVVGFSRATIDRAVKKLMNEGRVYRMNPEGHEAEYALQAQS